MASHYDYVGKVFDSLTVVARHPERSSSNKVLWQCRCECGSETLVTTQALASGNTKSCGCRRKKTSVLNGQNNKTHGMTRTPEYKAWQSMKDRCYNEDCPNYPLYGGRGILVWADWIRSFERFYRDMGPRPSPKHSLDRIDVNGNYRPDNCRWATAKEQSNNKRNNHMFEYDGQRKTLTQWADLYGIPIPTLSSRLFRDQLSIEEALAKVTTKREYTHAGMTKRLNEWAKELGISYLKLYHRVVTNRQELSHVIQQLRDNGHG